MLRYVLTRLLYTLPVVWLVVSVVFLLIHLVPGDPVTAMLGEGAASADIAATRHAYGLDVPIPQQYLHYWKGVVTGNLGQSIRFNQNVGTLIAQRYPFTLELTIASLVVALGLSIPAGVVSVEDVLEQIVGEIEDEFDILREPPARIGKTPVVLEGSQNIRDLDLQYDLELPRDQGFETLGGFVLSRLQKIPQGGEHFDYQGRRYTVLTMDGRRVGAVKVEPIEATPVATMAKKPD